MVLSFIIWLIISYISLGIAEYFIHKNFMHKRFFKSKALAWIFEDHHISHHKHENYNHNIDLPFYFHLLVGSPVILLLGIYSWMALVAFLVVCFYHSYLWTHSHRMIHGLEYNWMANWGFYHDIREHHEKHHDHPNKNYGVCFFFMDRLFGTKI